MSDLKPCPFCGKEPRINRDFRYLPGRVKKAFEVVCDNFKCPIYHADNTYFFSEEEAIEAWNRRAEDE